MVQAGTGEEEVYGKQSTRTQVEGTIQQGRVWARSILLF